MKIVFMGSPEFAVASLGALIHSGHEVSLVVTQPDKPAGRGQKVTPCAVAAFAREEGIPIVQPQSLKNNAELIDKLKALAPDVIVVVAYGKILPKELLQIPRLGCMNVHSSLLPKYRGAAPINWAIINGEKETGVTTMFINEKMDEGDILLQCATEIMDHDTAETLHDHLAAMGAELLIKTLDQVKHHELKGEPQNHALATYTPKLKKDDGLIDWQMSAVKIYDRIRGLQPWPRAFTHLPDDKENLLTIFEAAPLDVPSKEAPGTVTSLEKGIFVATGDGQLCILELQLPGKKRMPAIEYLKGSKLKVGDRFL